MGFEISGICQKCGKPFNVPLAYSPMAPVDDVALNDLMCLDTCPECNPEEWMEKRDAFLGRPH